MSNVPTRNEWLFGKIDNITNDRQAMLRSLLVTMLTKTMKIFKYNNLPDTIKQKDLETILQVNGYGIWKMVDGKLYVFYGGLGGEPNAYYLPTIAIVSNPYLRYSADLEIDKECVVMLNDDYYQGFMPLFNKYGNLLVDAEISLKYAILNARVPSLVTADNDQAYESAKKFFDNVVNGKEYGIIISNSFFEGIKTHDFYKQNYIKDLIESIQYIKGSWYNEIGLHSAFNMKREAVNESEVKINDDILRPSIDDMLKCRQDALEKINKMYGTNISVELDTQWLAIKEQEEIAMELQEKELKEGESENETERNVDNESTDE